MINLYLCETVNETLYGFHQTMRNIQYNDMIVILTVSLDKKYIGFIYCGELDELLETIDTSLFSSMDINAIRKEDAQMITKQIKDSNGNVVYEEHDDGYVEENTYQDDKLIRSEQHYSNGIIEVEHFSDKKTQEVRA